MCSQVQAETISGHGIAATAQGTTLEPRAETDPCSMAFAPGMLATAVGAAASQQDGQCPAEDVERAVTLDAHDETSSQLSEQEHAEAFVDVSQSPLSVAERSLQALADAGEMVVGLIAAKVSIGRPPSATCVENVSVDAPEPVAGVQVTSSEENSPQLVDVLRQSALHDWYHDDETGRRRLPLERAAAPDSDMIDVLAQDSLDLDDSWVTVEGSLDDDHGPFTDADQPRNSLEAALGPARGFLRRHLLHRLRPSPGRDQ
jgi:hypothetical protein